MALEMNALYHAMNSLRLWLKTGRPTEFLRAVVLLSVASTTPAQGRTWLVLEDGTGDAPTIQAATDSTSPGDSILVGPGTYLGEIRLPTEVSLLSMSGPEATTLDRGGLGTCIVCVNATGILIEGFRIVGADQGFGIAGTNTQAVIRTCHVDNEWLSICIVGELTLVDSEIRNGSGVFFQAGDGPSTLHIEGCLFENNWQRAYDGEASIIQLTCSSGGCGNFTTIVTVRDCEFRNNTMWDEGQPLIGYDYLVEFAPLTMTVEGNLFVENTGPAFGPADLPVWGRCELGSNRTAPILEFIGNTVAKSSGCSFGSDQAFYYPCIIERNVITGGAVGIRIPDYTPDFVISCNLVWGNGENWVDVPDLTGTDGNLSEPPKYCSPLGDDFTLAENSPCLPENNSCGVRIGAFGQGCDPIALTSETWAGVKARYR
jgi:hypothetical protein